MVASFCKGHLSPIWIGSNFQAATSPLLFTPQGRAKCTVGSWWLVEPPKTAPGQISFRGRGWPTLESTDVLGQRVEQGFAVCL